MFTFPKHISHWANSNFIWLESVVFFVLLLSFDPVPRKADKNHFYFKWIWHFWKNLSTQLMKTVFFLLTVIENSDSVSMFYLLRNDLFKLDSIWNEKKSNYHYQPFRNGAFWFWICRKLIHSAATVWNLKNSKISTKKTVKNVKVKKMKMWNIHVLAHRNISSRKLQYYENYNLLLWELF